MILDKGVLHNLYIVNSLLFLNDSMGDAQEVHETFRKDDNTIILTPGGAGVTDRYPAAGSSFDEPVATWIVTNLTSESIWVACDRDADKDAHVGRHIAPGAWKRIPVTTKDYISVDGGDGTEVQCDPYRFS